MEKKLLNDPQDSQTISPDTKLEWAKPLVKEADIAGITQTAGLGNNDGFISHT